MECFVGIDLGSTTTKAVFLDSSERVLGKGITNSRSNYFVACQVAKEEAETATRFILLEDRVRAIAGIAAPVADRLLEWIRCKYALAQHLKQLRGLEKECQEVLAQSDKFGSSATAAGGDRALYRRALETVFDELAKVSESQFVPGSHAQSNFFRDIATSLFLKQAEAQVKESGLSFDRFVGIFDKAILRVENHSYAQYFSEYLDFACREVLKINEFESYAAAIRRAVEEVISLPVTVVQSVGTGYGRLTLPFPKEQIRSEILCHGLGAHAMFPATRTVLDIGGQDTKAIQVDGQGIVTGFQMNDRCAAGCGRYLGYIADEMNIGVHQLGPLAMQSTKNIKINSTCTVFAGAELRERLSMGEKREDILAGLHRAIILRAMSLLARSGGVTSEFTFTGGVGRNEAAVQSLRALVHENYGEMKINISTDSIFTGALGGALFAKRERAA